ncbi:MAG: flagellar biosynthesis anti-sigma factor FlgM [bacterium]|jgi:anti-sigma28 factor (negative regulator of flagellin synthesis)
MSTIPSTPRNPGMVTLVDRASVIARLGPRAVPGETQPQSAGRGLDEVSLSAEAQSASRQQPSDQPNARAERLALIKAQIQDGTYDSDDKLTIVADRIARRLG